MTEFIEIPVQNEDGKTEIIKVLDTPGNRMIFRVVDQSVSGPDHSDDPIILPSADALPSDQEGRRAFLELWSELVPSKKDFIERMTAMFQRSKDENH